MMKGVIDRYSFIRSKENKNLYLLEQLQRCQKWMLIISNYIQHNNNIIGINEIDPKITQD